MNPWPWVWLVLACAACLACGRQPVATPAPPTAASTPRPPAPPSSEGALPLLAQVAELRHATDVKNLAVAREQSPPPGFVPFNPAEGLPKDYARIIGYVMNFDRGTKYHLGSGAARCSGAVSDDGTLCPSVVLPGVQLSESQARRLVGLAHHQPNSPRASSCAERPHHSFVFYNAASVPVFEWVVNLRCGRGSLSAWALDRGTLASLHALCVELELGMCFVGDSRTLAAVEQAFAERHAETLPGGAKRLLPYPSGVSGDQPLNRLSTRERRELCAWNIQHTMSFLEPGAEARKNEAGSSSRLFDLAECTTGFPECSATVEALLPCLAQAQRGAPVFTALEAKCLQHIDCLWGFALTPSPNP